MAHHSVRPMFDESGPRPRLGYGVRDSPSEAATMPRTAPMITRAPPSQEAPGQVHRGRRGPPG